MSVAMTWLTCSLARAASAGQPAVPCCDLSRVDRAEEQLLEDLKTVFVVYGGHTAASGTVLTGAGAAVSSGEEDDMSDTTPALDEAFERMAAASFELPNGFVNHGAMACEALAMLDCADDIDSWARRFARVGGARIEPVASAGFERRQAPRARATVFIVAA
jgi:hypothetical protein